MLQSFIVQKIMLEIINGLVIIIKCENHKEYSEKKTVKKITNIYESNYVLALPFRHASQTFVG